MNNASMYLPPELQAEQTGVDRKRKLAEALIQQGMSPLGMRDAGVYRVAPNALEGLAKMMQVYGGMRGAERADAAAGEIGQRAQAGRQQALAQALQMAQGSPGRAEDTSGEGTGSFDMSGSSGPAVTGQRAPNPLGAYAQLAASGDPMAMQAGGQMLGFQQKQEENRLSREARMEEKIMALDAAAQNAMLSREERTQRAREAEALRREMQQAQFAQQRSMAQMAASLRQPQQEQIIQTAEGPMRLVNGQAVPITGPTGAPVKPPAGRGGPMTATAQKELIQTEEEMQGSNAALTLLKQAQSINKNAMGFKGAGAVAALGTILPDALRPARVDATQELDNIIQSQALPQLKAIFGGMPTEGERKILLDVQGSSSKPASVREGIFRRAETAIQNRLKFSAEKAKRLREGTYFSGDGLPSVQGAEPYAGPERRGGPGTEGFKVLR